MRDAEKQVNMGSSAVFHISNNQCDSLIPYCDGTSLTKLTTDHTTKSQITELSNFEANKALERANGDSIQPADSIYDELDQYTDLNLVVGSQRNIDMNKNSLFLINSKSLKDNVGICCCQHKKYRLIICIIFSVRQFSVYNTLQIKLSKRIDANMSSVPNNSYNVCMYLCVFVCECV